MKRSERGEDSWEEPAADRVRPDADDGWGETPDSELASTRARVEAAYGESSPRPATSADFHALAEVHGEVLAAAQGDVGDRVRTPEGMLTAADREALAFYTSPEAEYLRVNEPLREGTITEIEAIADRSHDVSLALTKLPETTATVYRCPGYLSDAQLGRYEPGAQVVENAYTSASFNPELPWDGNTRMVIESRHGRVIDALSQVPDEHEVVFDRCSRFEVLDRTFDDATQRWTITLREVDPDSE